MKKIKSRISKVLRIIAFSMIFAGFIFVFYWFLKLWYPTLVTHLIGPVGDTELNKRGIFGDSFGLLSALINLCSAIVLIFTLYYQRVALNKQIEDSERLRLSTEKKETINFVISLSSEINSQKDRVIYFNGDLNFKKLQLMIQSFSINLNENEILEKFLNGDRLEILTILNYDNFTSLILNNIQTTEDYLSETSHDKLFKAKCRNIYIGSIGRDVFINYLRLNKYLRLLTQDEKYKDSFSPERKLEIASFKYNVSEIANWFINNDSQKNSN